MSRNGMFTRSGRISGRRVSRAAWSPWPASVQARAAALFDVQMWLWGRDVIRTEGNLLLARGLARVPPRGSEDGRTFYRLSTEMNSVALWGWGIFYGVEGLGGLFINRQRFQLSWTAKAVPPTDAWKFDDLTDFCSPQSDGQCAASHLLLREALSWIASYERWISEATSPDYRRSCLTSRIDWPAMSRRIAAELADDTAANATAIAWEGLLEVSLKNGPSNANFA